MNVFFYNLTKYTSEPIHFTDSYLKRKEKDFIIFES